jgi:DNA repair exonuclease SbcCD ATPase subunit
MDRHSLSALNKQICRIEEKLSAVYRQKVENLCEEKKKALQALEKPAPVLQPTDDLNKDLSSKIESKKTNIGKLDSALFSVLQAAKLASDTVTSCKKASNQISSFRTQLLALEEDYKRLELPIPFKKIIDVRIDTNEIDSLSEQAIKEKETNQLLADEIPLKRQKMTEELEVLTSRLNEPSRLYEKYLKELEDWEINRREIIGAPDRPDTLNFYEHELENLKGLPGTLAELKGRRLQKSLVIFEKLRGLASNLKDLYVAVQKFINNDELAKTLEISLDVSIEERGFAEDFLERIHQNKKGILFRGGDGKISNLVGNFDFNDSTNIKEFLTEIDDLLTGIPDLAGLVKCDVSELYDLIFSLEFLEPTYLLRLFGKRIEQLSPGQRGSLLLVFYLLVDKDQRPLIIDQPEGNLDGQYIYRTLVAAIRRAKQNRQIIIATHNSNLAVCCDSEQIIHATIDRGNSNAVQYVTGALENPELKQVVVDKLEGTPPAFQNRKDKFSFGMPS